MTRDNPHPRPAIGRLRTKIEHELDRRSVRLAVWVPRRTRGRAALFGRTALVLNTRGRRTGRERSVPLQYFPDEEGWMLVAANSGLSRPPAWYLNLLEDPEPSVEIDGRRLSVSAEELPDGEAEARWPRVLEMAPDYARYRKRTSRRIPLIRLTPRRGSG